MTFSTGSEDWKHVRGNRHSGGHFMSTVGEVRPEADRAASPAVVAPCPAGTVSPGEPFSTARLVTLFHAELRRIAAQRLAGEWAGHSLQVTALTNEAVLRIMGGVAGDRWESPADFFAAASEAMRRILVDAARKRNAIKRGGGIAARLDISSLGLAAPDIDHEILVVDDILDALAAADSVAAEIVRLRYFAGLTVPEVAAALGVPRRTVDRRWAYARAWIGRHLRKFGAWEDDVGEGAAEA